MDRYEKMTLIAAKSGEAQPGRPVTTRALDLAGERAGRPAGSTPPTLFWLSTTGIPATVAWVGQSDMVSFLLDERGFLVAGPYSATALDCTLTFPSVRRCTQNQRYSAPAKIAPTNWAAT